jgi:hypothetical protein
MSAFLKMATLPNLRTFIVTVPVPLDAMLSFFCHHHNLLEKVKVASTSDICEAAGREFKANNLAILEAPYIMLRCLLPCIESAPKLEAAVYKDTGEYNPAILSLERDMRDLSRFASSLHFIRILLSVHNEMCCRYIKLAYRGLRIEPSFTSLTVLQISRSREDKVFIPLPFTVSMTRYFLSTAIILTKA